MDDRQIRICFQVFLSMVMIIVFSFTGEPLVLIGGLLMASLLGYLVPSGVHFISNVFGQLVYGFFSSDDSYEYRSFQDDMDKAKSLVRGEEYDKAIHAYREIIQKSPLMCEPRYNLAQIYWRAGYPGLALSEYNGIVAMKDQFGSTHPLVLESERATEELKSMLSQVGKESLNNT
ncbi:MAG: tetratricopeptide repeat protein [Deltaproteobacteria bacterium]|nr:tetratricopeptide repeat protein [Deltaproteobacteria bacterium]